MNATRYLLGVLRALARRSWIASALCVVVCAGFAARAAAHVFEATYLAESTAVSPPPAVTLLPPPVPKDTGQASALVDRNVFCSTCTGAGDPPPLPDEQVTAPTSLVLVATSLGDRARDSYATLTDTTRGAQGAYWTGQRVPGAGTLEKVAGTYVLLRSDAGAVARVDLGRGPAPPAATPVAVAVAAAQPAGPAPAWASRVNVIDDHTFEVDRTLLQELMNAGAKVPGVRVTPALGKDGKLQGVRVAQARKESLAAGLGLRSGDIVQAIDGTALDSTDTMLAMYGRLGTASQVRVAVLRAGKPMELEYRLR